MKERNPYCLLAFAIVLIWALWNYNVSLKLLEIRHHTNAGYSAIRRDLQE
jgi:hypothetical protein